MAGSLRRNRNSIVWPPKSQKSHRRKSMLSQDQRTTIVELHAQGVSKREIARVLNISRLSVRKVLRANSAEVPKLLRPEKAEPHRQQILELLDSCKGNLVRVREELAASGVHLSYSTLTAFCRRHGIGQQPIVPSGNYHFQPGEEIQHDTSPHELELSGKRRKVQTASAVLCYSRILFFQMYPTFQRFDCKVFLTDALRYFGSVPTRVVIDNTHVVVLRGTGREMVPVPEMAAFAERFGFQFVAHELGDANRSARVERPFWFIEKNFLAGRRFASWQDLNQQARQWCDRVNATYKKHIRAARREQPAPQPSPGRTTHPPSRSGNHRLRHRPQATQPQAGRAGSAPAPTLGARLSPGTAPGRRARSGPLRTLRPGPGRAHDPAPRGPGLLPAEGKRRRLR